MFKTGLKDGLLVLVVVAIAAAISLLSNDSQIVIFTIDATTIIGWIIVGYLYKRNHGSLIALSSAPSNSNNNNNFWHYIFAVGLIWGPAKLLISGYPSSDVSVLANIFIAIAAIPLSGIAVIGAIIIGGMFCKGGKYASNN